jgi:hypothetical protein
MPIYPYSFQLPPLSTQDIPNNGAVGEFLGISAGGVLDWLPVASGGGDMLKADNLSGLASYPTARTNLGLGTGDSPTFKNLTISTGTIATSAPVTISQTWNDAAVAFTAFKVNATSTNSATGSLLLDLQVGTVSQLNVTKAGVLFLTNSTTSGGIDFNGFGFMSAFNWQMRNGNGYIGLGATATEADTRLYRDTNNTLALRNSTAAQTFNVYGTSSSSNTVYERMFAKYNSTDLAFQIGTETAGATLRPLDFVTGGSRRMTIGTTGNVGIGTTAPTEKLHVVGGNVLFGDAADATGAAGNGDLTLRAYRTPQIHVSANNASGNFFGLNLELNNNIYAGLLLNLSSGEVKIGGLSNGGYFPAFYSNNVEAMRISTAGNVGIGTTAPSSKLHVAGNSSPAIAIENTIATGYSELLFKNTVATGSSIFLNGSTQTGYGGANSLNVYTSNGPLAFHTASVTNAISLAQSGDFKVDKKILGNNGINIGNTANNYDRAIIANSGGGLAITNGGSAGESLQFTEMTAPAAPAANQVRIYAEDDGTGKTRLMALFATGVAQQIAIQP